MTIKGVLGISSATTCNQNLHREVRQNSSQRTLNYEVTTASSFWLGLTHKANFCLTYAMHQIGEEDPASLGTLCPSVASKELLQTVVVWGLLHSLYTLLWGL